MESGRSSFPAALMHLFYYQQGMFSEETEQSSILEEEHAASSLPKATQESPMLQPSDASQDTSGLLTLHQHSYPSSSSVPAEAGEASAPVASSQGNVKDLQKRRRELKAKMDLGALQEENQALESKVLQTQEDFIALQTEFKDMKEQYGARLDSLRLALEEQQSAGERADRRAVCAEDLVRYHQEQRKLMAGHWKSQCQMKDERIRYLNLQLTEYTVDWQQLGVQKQSEASLSHEHHCLADRHELLQATQQLVRNEDDESPTSRGELQKFKQLHLAEVEEEDHSLHAREAEAASKAAQLLSPSELAFVSLNAECDSLRAKISLLSDFRRQHEAAQEPPSRHRCIWRDELDVRESQLEKITTQLEKTSAALRSAQEALAFQREKHQDMKARHAEAEAQLREGERERVHKQRRCQELRRAELAVQRLLEAAEAHGKLAAAGSLDAG
eukprot:TRINITY_DN19910_c0_g1_i2.p1 TRINITY_DN19910_c0_g1~~TRINITY_DN19910_c0_g1_i2.p1  ORF type:complete len:444 (+),score=112.04 TRINITY_DN19910_c0_g1_i2:124-1455(+)